MKRLTDHTGVKSEKIRILYRTGVERADIARFLDITYQHVQNVLKRSGLLEPANAPGGQGGNASQVYMVTVEANSRIVLPPAWTEAQGISRGDVLICRQEEGGLRIMSREAAAEALHETMKQRMPAEAALLEALLDRSKSG
ncbi:AbrB/MazE/SpoVT family DNA-binding domain-containing protein [Pelagerythrobacter sp.]|uniref:AbrB/MazE/SpoVT family DNA-binding domain-containing protein n=1 Tax=Pelagerythrobacter sp. TaxID=2800702 RepID=UPI0035B01907